MKSQQTDKDKMIKDLLAKGAKPAEIHYIINQLEKRHTLGMTKSRTRIREINRTILHSEETDINEYSSFDAPRTVGSKLKPNSSNLTKAVTRKRFVPAKSRGKPMAEDVNELLIGLIKEGLTIPEIVTMLHEGGALDLNEDFIDLDEVGNLVVEAKVDRRKVGKVKLTPGKPMSKKEYAAMKAAALSKKKKVVPQSKPKSKDSSENTEGLSGNDLITQHPQQKQIRSVLSTIAKTAHKELAVNWLINKIKDGKNNEVKSFVASPYETMKSILQDHEKNKRSKVTLPRVSFLEHD